MSRGPIIIVFLAAVVVGAVLLYDGTGTSRGRAGVGSIDGDEADPPQAQVPHHRLESATKPVESLPARPLEAPAMDSQPPVTIIGYMTAAIRESKGGRVMANRDGEYVTLLWDNHGDHPEFIRGHVAEDVVRTTLMREGINCGNIAIAHAYARWGFPSEFALDRESRELRVCKAGPGAFPVTIVEEK